MKKDKTKKERLVKWGILAVSFAILVVAGFSFLAPLINNYLISHEKIDKRYKRLTLSTDDSAYVWSWKELTESERPYEVEIDGIKYVKFRSVSEEFVGDKIGEYTVVGCDAITEEQHPADCTMYQLKGVNQTEFMAGIITDKYYIFRNDVYDPPQTLGEMFDRVDLSQFVKLERFSKSTNAISAKVFLLNDDEYVWEILSSCRDAAFVDADQIHWHMYERKFISFSISSKILPIYKQAFSITEDGYLWTNAFQWGYLYYIGEDAAEKIIKYAKSNSKKAVYEPYDTSKYVYGKIVDITDDYVLVDDSILCKKKSQGITYKVLMNDVRFSRCVNKHNIGDLVQISYVGEVDKENSNTISTAFSMRTLYISD